MAHIVRINGNHTRGWQAREYTIAPRYVSKLFSDRQYGGEAAAYKAALKALSGLKRLARRTRTMEES